MDFNQSKLLKFSLLLLCILTGIVILYPHLDFQRLLAQGDHIRKRRLDLMLLQRQVVARIGVTESTIYNWESGTNTPETRYIPKIHAFMGYSFDAP